MNITLGMYVCTYIVKHINYYSAYKRQSIYQFCTFYSTADTTKVKHEYTDIVERDAEHDSSPKKYEMRNQSQGKGEYF